MEKEKTYCYQYPRPAITTDCIVWSWEEGLLKVLLIERGGEPFKGQWALPGGFMEMDEDAATCASRELKEETGIDGTEIRQLGAFSAIDRDPRYRVVSIAYYTFVRIADCRLQAGDDAKRAEWFPVGDLPDLAFDHCEIISKALQRLKEDIALKAEAHAMIARKLTAAEMQALDEFLLQTK